MRKTFILSVLGILLFHVSVANAAPRLDQGANEATEVIEVQEGLDVSPEQGDDDIDANEAEEHPDEIELEDSAVAGTVEAISETSVTIDGVVYTIDANTELDEGLQVGVVASVEFVTLSDGTLLATEVETDAPDDLVDEDENEAEDEDNDESEQEHEEEHDSSGQHDSEESGHHGSGDSDESDSED